MSDPRKRHPGHDPSIPPKRMQGVELRDKPIPVERGDMPAPSTSSDPWVQRITAATALVVALSAAGWGGAKITERDVPSAQEAKELTEALKGCQRDVVSLKNHVEAIEKQEEKHADEMNLHAKQLAAHAQVIYLLNGRVAPIWRWPEARPDDWISGTDNLHRHVQRGGRYPGAPE